MTNASNYSMSCAVSCPSYIICIFLLLAGLNLASTVENGKKIMACYFTVTKSQNFSGDAIDPFLCTHIICASGIVTRDGVETEHPEYMEQYKAVAGLKDKNPNLKVMVSLQYGFQSVADQPFSSIIEKFAVRAVSFLEKLNMDGFDLDWEFPEVFEKEAYIRFIKILSAYLHTSNLLLSMAVPATPYRIDNGFDLPTINKYVDFVTVMNYDYHAFNDHDKITGYNSPLYTPAGEKMYMSTAESLTFFLERGLFRNKTLMGIPTYGRSWTLADPKVHGLHSPAIGQGAPAPHSSTVGVYIYADVCVAMMEGATRVLDEVNIGEYIYNGTSWVAFEGKYSIGKKIQWLKERDLAGVGIWAYQLDDIYNVCGYNPMPLLNWLKDGLSYGNSPLYFSPEH